MSESSDIENVIKSLNLIIDLDLRVGLCCSSVLQHVAILDHFFVEGKKKHSRSQKWMLNKSFNW